MQQLTVLQRRVRELDAGLDDVRAQYAGLERVGTPAALEFIEDLWFEAAAL
jgi:hypothetical protein